MARTESTMAELGNPAPEFALPEVIGKGIVSLDTFGGRKALLVMFVCRHCPYVKHVQDELARLGRDYQGSELAIVAISSNDADAYPDDAPESLAEWARDLGFEFPLCYDASQDVAKSYRAACTPDFFLYDATRRLVYRGQLDGSRPGSDRPVTGSDLRAAIQAVLNGDLLPTEQRPSLGCNIKWKPGNAPDYFA